MTAILAAVIFASFFGCKDKTTKPDISHTSTFPLAAGNYWHYLEKDFSIPIHHTSDSDTLIKDIYRTISGPISIGNVESTYAVKDSIAYQNDSTVYFIRMNWYKFENGKIMEYAYYPHRVDPYRIDTLIYSDAKAFLDLPLNPGKSWISYEFGNYIEKHVIGSATNVGRYGFSCDLVERKYLLNHGNQDSAVIIDYFNNNGLIMQTGDYTFTVFPDSLGNLTDSIRNYLTMELLDYHIPGSN
jgi:hypothetical protein